MADDLSFLEDEASATATGDNLRFDGRAGSGVGRETRRESGLLLFLSLPVPVKGSSVVCGATFLVASTGPESRGGEIMEG